MKIQLIDKSLTDGNAYRGVGIYTKYLLENLQKNEQLQLVTEEPDLIHYPFFDLFFNTLPINLFRKVKTVVTAHDVIPLIFPDYYPVGVKGKLKFKKQKLALQKVDAVVTDSESSKKDINKYLGVDLKKIHVVYLAGNPLIENCPKSEIGVIRRRYYLPEKYILYVGDINYNKNIPELIKSLKFLDEDIYLLLVGKNFHEQKIPEWQWIETAIAMADVKKRVKFIDKLGVKAEHDLSRIYSGALTYVQPSLYEGFGLPVLEAMQAKTPVIVSENSSLTEVAGEFALYTDPTAESISEQIKEVISWSKTKRNKVIKDAYNWSQTFSWEKTAKETVEVYKRIVNSIK